MPLQNTVKPQVIVLTRVSTNEQDLERQIDIKNAIIKHFGLEEIQHGALKISGTVVLKTTGYKNAMGRIHNGMRIGIRIGMVVPALDRWFRLKMELLSQWGTQLAEYVKPFEVVSEDGTTVSLIYTTLTASDGAQEFYALDLRNSKHQEILLEAVKYATKERVTITNRFTSGKDSARMNPEMKVDGLPNGVEFVPYPGQNRFDHNGRRKTRIKGYVKYNEYASRVAKPIIEGYDEGTPMFQLWKEYRPLAAEIVSRLGLSPASKKLNTGLRDVHCVHHILTNQWWLGIKHRTLKTTREFNEDTQKFEVKRVERTDESRYEIETNLAGWVNPDRPNDPSIPREPLISREVWDRVQARLAVRLKEYGSRTKLDLEHLAHPLFHCMKCGNIMYPLRGYDSGMHKRDDTYICGTRRRFRVGACNEPSYNRKKFDDEVALKALFYLRNPVFVSEKLQEMMNENRTAELQAEVDHKKITIADIEKRLKRLRRLAEETDDEAIGSRIDELRVELREANNALFAAQSTLEEEPNFDIEVATRIIIDDMSRFPYLEREEQKKLLARYITKIYGTQDPVTGRYYPKFEVKINLPFADEEFPEWGPTPIPGPPPPSDGQPVECVHAEETMGGARWLPKRTLKSGGR